jgi:hypothetical protein
MFLTGLAPRWPGIRVVFHDVENDATARQEMLAVARAHGKAMSSLPAILVCGRWVSGYRTDATTGREIEDLLRESSTRPADRISMRGAGLGGHSAPSPAPAQWREVATRTFRTVAVIPEGTADDLPLIPESVPLPGEGDSPLPPEGSSANDGVYVLSEQAPEEIELPWFGRIRLRDLGLPLFTMAIGLIDGFNPCAMWVLVFLLSVLANVKDRRKILAIAGTFVLVSGAAYYAFMAAWLNLFMFIDLVRPLQIAIGVLAIFIGIVNVKDFFAFKQGISLSIPESAKPGIYNRVRRIVSADYLTVAIGLSVVLAIVVNLVELLCTAGLPAIYTQILSQQQLRPWQNYAYLALYIAGYIFDDSLMVGAFVITLSHRKMRESEGRWLKLISGVVVLALGLTVLAKPEWLQWGSPQ